MRHGRRIGVDVGDVRIGVAICDPSGLIATPLTTVSAGPRSIAEIAAIVGEHDALECVVGLPRSLSGGEGPAALKVRTYAGQLAREVVPVAVRLFDERMTTMTADNLLRAAGTAGKKKRAVIDQAAATVILQTALDAERISGNVPGETCEDL